MALHPGERKRHFPEELPVAWDPIRRALEEDEDWYRDLVEHSQDLLCVHDLEGRFLSVNPVPARLLGYSVEEILRKPMRDFVDPQFHAQFDAYLHEIEQTGEARGLLAVLTRSGEQRIWEYHNTLRTEGVAKPIVRGIAHDVTERVRAEKAMRASNERLLKTVGERERTIRELTLFRALLDQSNDAIEVVDPETARFLDVNERACVELGYSREELLSMTVFDIDPDYDEGSRTWVRQQLQEAAFLTTERVHRRKDGTTFPVEVNLRRVRLDREYGVAVSRDITERKRAEKALHASNGELLKTAREQERTIRELTLFRALLDQSNDAIKVIDPESLRFLDVNEKSCMELGYSREELLSMTVFDIDPNADKSLLDRVRQQLRESGFAIMETVHRRKDGTTFPVEVNMQQVRLDREYCVSISRDITERKRAEDRLREFERVVENLEEMIVVVSRDRRYLLANRAALRYRGISKEQLIGRHVTEVVHTELYEMTVKGKLDESFAGHIVSYEAQSEHYPGLGVRDLACTYLPIEGPTGIDRVACILRDITERKRAVAMLRESELRFRAVYERSPIGIALVDSCTGRFLQVNPKYCEIAGRSEEELLQIDVASITHPDDVGNTGEFLRQLAEGELANYDTDKRYVRPDGSVRWVRILVVPMWSKGETRRWHMGLVEDITEQKLAEEALRERERIEKLVLDHLPVGVVLTSGDEERTIYQNPKFLELFGYSIEQFPTVAEWWPLAYPDPVYREQLSRNWQRRMEAARTKGEIEPNEVTITCHDGTEKYVRVLGRVIGDRNFVTFIDLTERRQAEEALRQSEERFRVALKNSPIAVFNQDRDLRYTWMYNSQPPLSDSEKLGKTVSDVFAAAEAARATEVRRRVLETGTGVRDEMQLTYRGKKHYFDTTIEPVFDAAGAVIGITGASTDVTELRETAEALREAKKKLTEEKLYLEQEIDTELGFGEIIGQSKALEAVMEQVGKVAASDATVLLLGETGTGKELVARAIHWSSPRTGNSFIKLNCAAIPTGLLESELFGNEKGAFTGAVSKKIGRIELADKGTLFLDEIGEISLALQPKLLRVLQDQEFERLGGTQTLKVDFRLIAATNRDLAESVRENEFRSDLYYRLNVFPIRVPPLRERREDIRLLVEHFVQKFARRMNKSITSIPKKTMDALMGWEWPGNVRELENFIERSVILTQGSVLVSPLSELETNVAAEKSADETLEATEREHILRALRESHGQIGGLRGAAMRLGLKRTTLQSKLKHLGINPRSGSTEH